MIKEKYDTRHGGPFDRGGADYYYCRPFTPHYYVAGTMTSDYVGAGSMTDAELDAYRAGYEEAESFGAQKDWG